jgi:hypothetical protein
MKATLIFQDRFEYADGAIIEMTIWRVGKPVQGSEHFLKYSLFYGYPGRRVIGYDNERGKGDHRHFGQNDAPYNFVSPEKLVSDFFGDVRRLRGEE